MCRCGVSSRVLIRVLVRVSRLRVFDLRPASYDLHGPITRLVFQSGDPCSLHELRRLNAGSHPATPHNGLTCHCVARRPRNMRNAAHVVQSVVSRPLRGCRGLAQSGGWRGGVVAWLFFCHGIKWRTSPAAPAPAEQYRRQPQIQQYNTMAPVGRSAGHKMSFVGCSGEGRYPP